MLYGHYEVLSIKKLKIAIDHPVANDALQYGCDGEGLPVIEKLLRQGLNPNDQDNGGCSAIQHLLERLEWYRGRDYYSGSLSDRPGDSERARDRMKAVHLLARHGARWRPSDRYETNSARRSLLKMTPDYTVEFAWIMQQYGGCAKQDIESLIRTAAMKGHLARHRARLHGILDAWPDETPPDAEER